MAHPVQSEVKVDNSLIQVRELKSGANFIQIDNKVDGDGLVIIHPSNIDLRADFVRGVYELESAFFAGHKAAFTISEELMGSVKRLSDHVKDFGFGNGDSRIWTIHYEGAVATAVLLDKSARMNYLIADVKALYATQIAHVDPPEASADGED